ncbi:hypothetical protein [Kitasatospora sp. NPDC001683]
MTPEAAGPRAPVAVLPLWRRGEGRGEEHRDVDVDRPGVLRGHPGPVASGQPQAMPDEA